ncbi:L-lysine exporter family protein LysE/ArgO [Rhodopseudomonas julia]|uniref:L-lysine exporter family protein LysE/ArgO n=1 Tax=Rhodopseudomonas julia TaxID=200617 RepID=A0ABU0C7V0_9BRAD|nr:LysE/ArgO family amino acid transporter [Rhodopseudomonas julia]MDQ0326594.1 L-lysine exporter family protein LysE/ArgO [Rhodopseudomonas julia]
MNAALAGFSLGLGLILAIGAQNAFVLRQGLVGRHVFAVCLVCALSDAVLISAGVAGASGLMKVLPWLEMVMRYGGALFLITYALKSFYSALKPGPGLQPLDANGRGLGAAVATCLAFTWLNPHVYLDTLVLLGSVSSQYEGERPAFALGAVTASFSFFFALGYGARFLRPIFADPRAWRVLDLLIGIIMGVIAVSLLRG